jgi:hypothetical protein
MGKELRSLSQKLEGKAQEVADLQANAQVSRRDQARLAD